MISAKVAMGKPTFKTEKVPVDVKKVENISPVQNYS